jgi:hypothetical protein
MAIERHSDSSGSTHLERAIASSTTWALLTPSLFVGAFFSFMVVTSSALLGVMLLFLAVFTRESNWCLALFCFIVTWFVCGVVPLITHREKGPHPGNDEKSHLFYEKNSQAIAAFWLISPGVLAFIAVLMACFFEIVREKIFLGAPSTLPWMSAILGCLAACPTALTVSTGNWLLRDRHTFLVTPLFLYVRRNFEWKRLALAEVQQVALLRNHDADESGYHQDDESQHHVSIRGRDGAVLEIYPTKFSESERARLFLCLWRILDHSLFTPRARGIILAQQQQEKGTEIAAAPRVIEGFNVTTNWERDMQVHIGRTNYVPLEHGEVVGNGRYTVNHILSSGGFSTTYVVTTADGARLVLKESAVPPNLSDEARAQVSEMFAREAKLLKRCSHDNIARIHDFFHERSREYLVLDYIEGIQLSQLVRTSGPIPEAKVADWAEQLASFLIHLHELEPPIVHRDFTPENLLLHRSGRLFLIDFGAANEFIGQVTGTLIGKQAYIAPEQLQGKAVPQSDIYAFGAVLYFLISGRDPLPLSELHPMKDGYSCTAQFDELVASCTHLDFLNRPGSCRDVLALLDTV